jgi:large-conductance mechanosensitive channel
MDDRQQAPERDLNQAGSIVDKSIEFMTDQKITPLAIASALLGGAIGVLCRTLPDDIVVQILNNAIDSIESGEMHVQAGKDHAGEA